MQKVNSRNKPPLIPLNGPLRHVVDTMLILLGSLVTALGFNLFFCLIILLLVVYLVCLYWLKLGLGLNRHLRSGRLIFRCLYSG